MKVLDINMDLEPRAKEQSEYQVLMNIGTPESGDQFVRVGEIEWQHNEQRVIIHPEEEDVV